MPIPKPSKKEDQRTFIDRCMSDLAGEFPKANQRIAVCLRRWRDKSKKRKG